MKTFNTNEVDAGDCEIYCATHKPKKQGNTYGAGAVGIQGAMYAQSQLKVKKLFFAKHHYLTFVVSDVALFIIIIIYVHYLSVTVSNVNNESSHY